MSAVNLNQFAQHFATDNRVHVPQTPRNNGEPFPERKHFDKVELLQKPILTAGGEECHLVIKNRLGARVFVIVRGQYQATFASHMTMNREYDFDCIINGETFVATHIQPHG